MELIDKLRLKIRKWLGIDEDLDKVNSRLNLLTTRQIELRTLLETDVAVDWGYKDNTVVIIATKAAGGHVKIFDIHLNDLNQMRTLANGIEEAYKPRWIHDKVNRRMSDEDWEKFLDIYSRNK